MTSREISLTTRAPSVSVADLLRQLAPPREFKSSSFENYRPDSRFSSQAKAVTLCQSFVSGKTKSGLFSKRTEQKAGIYLDGGFGVGKTHLLASLYHAFKGKKVFGSFLAYTDLIGVLGFAKTVDELAKYDFICIDEFELDDPGDTMMMSRLLSELQPKGVRFAATSNTPPNALGEGRFAAADFQREISAMADRFDIISIDGEDYRHRPSDAHVDALDPEALSKWAASHSGTVAIDDFELLLFHLSKLHPSRYVNLLDGIAAVAIKNMRVLHDQVEALRWVAFIDRLYENQIALQASGVPVTEVFSEEMKLGGYRKKYLRAVSRSGSLSSR
jgi:cell division protein ZapE